MLSKIEIITLYILRHLKHGEKNVTQNQILTNTKHQNFKILELYLTYININWSYIVNKLNYPLNSCSLYIGCKMVLLLKRTLGRYKSSFAHVQNETQYLSSHNSNNPLCHSQTLWESTILITLKGLLFVLKLRKVIPCLKLFQCNSP